MTRRIIPVAVAAPKPCDTCGGTGRIVAYGEEYSGEPVACGTVRCLDCAATPKDGE